MPKNLIPPPPKVRTENDEKYINMLAKNLDCKPELLRLIVGLDELKEILGTLTQENFNPKSKDYCANIHTHSIYSDGEAYISDILDEAQMRAEKNGKTFLIGINDHDTLEGARALVKYVTEFGEKYDKIRIVVSVEACFKYENYKILKAPIPFDAILYCINPFNEKIDIFFNTYTSKNKQYLEEVMANANKKWGINANYKEACAFHCLIKLGGTAGFFKFSKKYIHFLLQENGENVTEEDVFELFKPYCANQNGRVTLATSSIYDAIKIVKESGFGEIGLAHPAYVDINPKLDNGYDYESRINLLDDITYENALLTFLDECNLDIIELCYQYPEKAFKKYPQLSHLLTRINKYYVDKQITITGGTDSHGSDFGKILTGRY